MAARTVSLVGVPFDLNSSFLKGPAKAPAKIRQALRTNSSNTWNERLQDISELLNDLGDVARLNAADTPKRLATFIEQKLPADEPAIFLGGDHSITFPILCALQNKHQPVTLVHFDAHPDLYPDFEGKRSSHACPMARIMESGCVKHLIQIGIRTMNDVQQKQAERFNVTVLPMSTWDGTLPEAEGPVYISFDVDVLDPAFAPGVSHPEPGGMSTREAIRALNSIRGKVVAADVVEVNPDRDPSGATAMCAAKIVKELVGKMLE